VRISTSVPRALKRHHAKRGASAEAEVQGNALHTTQSFKMDVVCRNANAERERNFAKCWGLGGKYFAKFASRTFGFFWRDFGGAGIKKEKYITLRSRRSRDTKVSLCLTHPPIRAQICSLNIKIASSNLTRLNKFSHGYAKN